MTTVILDTDFLSSFLKIDRCGLIQSLYCVERALIPAAVYRELARTDFLTSLLAHDWLGVPQEEPSPEEVLVGDTVFQTLDMGEQACISLARAMPDALLLMNDNRARQFAGSLGLTVVNIPAFLLACRMAALVSIEEMEQIVEDLSVRDHYGFRPEILQLLLE
jgi:predicted nucleic acid-binding protein